MLHLTECSYHVMYMFQSEFKLYRCMNAKELLAWNRHVIWSLYGCNGTWTHNHSVCKRTLNHLAKIAKWLSCVVSISTVFICAYLYNTLKCICDMIRTYSQMHHRDKYSQRSSIICAVWLNGWVVVGSSPVAVT